MVEIFLPEVIFVKTLLSILLCACVVLGLLVSPTVLLAL